MKLFKKTNKIKCPSIWKSGQLLTFSGLEGQTDFRMGLCARTSDDFFGLDIVLPGKCQIRFGNRIESAELLGDVFYIETEKGEFSGVFYDSHHLLINKSIDVLNISDDITVISYNGKTLVGVKDFLKPSVLQEDFNRLIQDRKNWLTGKLSSWKKYPDSKSEVLAKAISLMKTQIYSPEGQIKHYWTTPDRWPHKGMWLWDSAFHSIGWRHLDVELAKQMIEAVLDVQRYDGLIPHTATPYESTNITQPPVLCLAVSKILEKKSDKDWLEKIYVPLCKYIKWDISNRDSDGFGLVEWVIDNNPECRSGESGMDNSPRFDSVEQLDAVDFNSYLARECELLSEFAEILGKAGESKKWAGKHKTLCEKINQRLWNNELGFYFDCEAETGKQSDVMANAGFLPLICGAASHDQAKKLAEHIENSNTFGTEFPVPTISRSQQQYYSKDMWRGPTWVNLNWLIAEGFERYGLINTAKKICQRTLLELEHNYFEFGTFFEFYDDRNEVEPPELLRKRKNDPSIWVHQVIFDYGWSATLYIDMLFNGK